VEYLQVIADVRLVNHFFTVGAQLSGSEAAELSVFSHKLNRDKTRYKEKLLRIHETILRIHETILRIHETILRIHETIPTTKYEAVTCQMKSRAEGFSEEKVSELFNLSESTVNSK